MIGFGCGFWSARSAVWGGEGAVFFGPVVPGGVHADDLPVGGELDRPGDQLLTDSAGKSFISFEDYAVAVLDELEHPRHVRRRFGVAY